MIRGIFFFLAGLCLAIGPYGGIFWWAMVPGLAFFVSALFMRQPAVAESHPAHVAAKELTHRFEDLSSTDPYSFALKERVEAFEEADKELDKVLDQLLEAAAFALPKSLHLLLLFPIHLERAFNCVVFTPVTRTNKTI